MKTPVIPARAMLISTLFVFTLIACNKDCKKTAWKEGCVCTEVYDPVCGCDNRTYGNSCEAECQGITKYKEGKCN